MIRFKKLNKEDVSLFMELIKLMETVFGTDPAVINEPYLKKLLAQRNFISIVAIENDKVLGGLTGYILNMYDSGKSEVYLYDIAVKKEYQRKGMGNKLITALHKYCEKRRIGVIFVEALEEDKQAVKFYRKEGGEEQKVIHFNFPLNV